jgi:streptomycin 6-kinase
MKKAVPIPDRLRDVTVTYFGEVGRDWLERLPDLVAQAARVWQLDVGSPFDPAGNIGWVAPVRRADGSEAVLKVSCPNHGSDAVGSSVWDGKALEHWAGRGAVRLFESDDANQTLLVERCIPGTTCDELDFAAECEVVASVLAELHSVELPERHEFEALSALVEHFRRTMWDWFDRLDAPFDRGVVAQADDLFTSLTSSSDDEVLLHGDLGGGNVVLSERGWLAIDPYPVVGDRAFDGRGFLSSRLFQRPLRAAREEVASLADRLNLDARRIAGWTFACSVQVALEHGSVGNAAGQREDLERAEQVATLRFM